MTQTTSRQARAVARALRGHGRTLDSWARWKRKTSNMHHDDANSFLLGVMLDRGVKWQQAWAAGEWMCDSLSDWDDGGVRSVWRALARMEKWRLRGFLRYGYGGYAFHKHHNVFARLLPRAAKHLLKNYGGDPRRIWNNQRNVNAVRDRLEAIPTIGYGLARMAVLILARDYGRLGGKKARRQLEPKPDMHVCRVFERSGLVDRGAAVEAVVRAAQRLVPEFPAALDAPAWDIGRNWCRPRNPKCGKCPIQRVCPRLDVVV